MESRKARIVVVGLGYVGLPLAVAFGEAGFDVVGVDLNHGRVGGINRGESPIDDVDGEVLAGLVGATAGDAGSLRASCDLDELSAADVVIVCVPTPVSASKEPDLSFVTAAVGEIAGRLKVGALVILESTTYPGTTEELVLPRLEAGRLGGLNGSDAKPEVGVDFFVAFSPERIDPGRTDFTVRTTPKVVGGMTSACLAAASAVYGAIVDEVVPVSLPRTAEMVKLLENTFRCVNIALANEMAVICDRLGIDVWEVIDAASTKPFGYMPFVPGPGLGGHCIPVDPHYLAWKLRSLNQPARCIQVATEVNEAMPGFVVSRVADALNAQGKAMNGARVLVLGVTYKPDVADLRESPVVEVIEKLAAKGAEVAYHDPFVPRLETAEGPLVGVELDEAELADADCVVIGTNHRAYDWKWVVKHSPLVFDTRNATRGVSPAAWVVKL